MDGSEARAFAEVPRLLEDASSKFRGDPSRQALLEGTQAWSWDELMGEVARVAKLLTEEDSRSPVGILLPSGISFLAGFLAAAALGRPACTLHPDWADPELEAAIADAGLSRILTFRPDLPGRASAVDPRAASAQLSVVPSEFPPIDADDDPLFYIGFTSGTSGRPKPFARRQKSWSSSFEPSGDLFSIESGDEVFLPGSLQHSHFLFGAVLGLNRGASVRLYERFDAEALAEDLSRASRSVLYLVPTMLLSLDESRTTPLAGVHSIVVSGAKLEPHHWEITRRLFPNASVNEIYGASELSFVTVNTDGELTGDPGFVGRPFPGVEIDIRPTGPEHREEGPGLVYVRSPYLFDGYLDGPATDRPTDSAGFMTVGDIGTLSPQGLSLSGRASNMLITGGKNVHPEEVETGVSGHPEITECVVAGVPHPHWGEEIVAFLVASPGTRPDAEQLSEYLRERVAGYKIPKRWFLVEAIPRTRAGKTDRSLDGLFDGATEL